MNIPFTVISTGSHGNAVILKNSVLIDCGVPYRMLEPYSHQLRLVLLTHIHGDHFRASTIKRLAYERPMLRFGCCRWLIRPLAEAGVRLDQIDVLEPDTAYDYGLCTVAPVELVHDVPNCGYKIDFRPGKVFYATDTKNLNGIMAKGYDLYMVEANYVTDEIMERIAEKEAAGEYAYEKRVLENHLSKEDCDDFLYRNIGPGGMYIYLHGHVDREKVEDTCQENDITG